MLTANDEATGNLEQFVDATHRDSDLAAILGPKAAIWRFRVSRQEVANRLRKVKNNFDSSFLRVSASCTLL